MTRAGNGSAASLIGFPAAYGIKVMGRQEAGFIESVRAILAGQLGDDREIEILTRLSRHQNYVSVSCTFHAQSREEIDRIYAAFLADPRVLMVL